MSSSTQAYVPIPNVKFLDPRTGDISREWYRFFVALMNRLGGADGPSLTDLQIDLSMLPADASSTFSNSNEELAPPTAQRNSIEDLLVPQTTVQVISDEYALVPPLTGTMPQDDLTPPVQTFRESDLNLLPPNAPGYGGSVTGSRGGNAALAALLTVLSNQGIISNNTTP